MKRRIGDRRGKPRFEIIGDLWGSVDLRAALAVVNLGRGGALLESSLPFPPDSVHAVVVVTGDETHKVTMRVRHSAVDDRRGRRVYQIGVQFLDISPALEEFLARQVSLGNDSLSVEA